MEVRRIGIGASPLSIPILPDLHMLLRRFVPHLRRSYRSSPSSPPFLILRKGGSSVGYCVWPIVLSRSSTVLLSICRYSSTPLRLASLGLRGVSSVTRAFGPSGASPRHFAEQAQLNSGTSSLGSSAFGLGTGPSGLLGFAQFRINGGTGLRPGRASPCFLLIKGGAI